MKKGYFMNFLRDESRGLVLSKKHYFLGSRNFCGCRNFDQKSWKIVFSPQNTEKRLMFNWSYKRNEKGCFLIFSWDESRGLVLSKKNIIFWDPEISVGVEISTKDLEK